MKKSGWQQKPQMLLALCLVTLLLAAFLWIASIVGFFPSPWSTILSALFTVLSVIFALIQLYLQRTIETSSSLFHAPSPSQQLISRMSSTGVSRRKGALLVYVKKKYLGSTIHLCRGFADVRGTTVRAANVVERWINGSPVFVAIFPAVEPENYTVHLDQQEHGALITISAGQTAEIDWRYRDAEK